MAQESFDNSDSAQGQEVTEVATRKAAISYFRASESIDNALSGFRGSLKAPPEAIEYLTVLRNAGREEGVTSNLLFRQSGGFSLLILWIKPNYPLPRHSHDSDCLYYIVSGSIKMGTITLRAGDGFLVPNACLYVYQGGPEGAELLEIRYDVDVVNSYVPPVSEKRVKTELDLVKANVERWRELHISPTFAANQAED